MSCSLSRTPEWYSGASYPGMVFRDTIRHVGTRNTIPRYNMPCRPSYPGIPFRDTIRYSGLRTPEWYSGVQYAMPAPGIPFRDTLRRRTLRRTIITHHHTPTSSANIQQGLPLQVCHAGQVLMFTAVTRTARTGCGSKRASTSRTRFAPSALMTMFSSSTC